MEVLLDAIRLGLPWCAVVFGLCLYILGVLLAWLSCSIVSISDFFLGNKPFQFAAFGIPFVSGMVSYMAKKLPRIFEGARNCFDVHDDAYSSLVSNVIRSFNNNKGILAFSLPAVVSLFVHALVSYPSPVFRQASNYTMFDLYTLLIFELVMVVMGTVCWIAVSVIYELRKVQKMPIYLEKIADLDPIMRIFLIYVASWFFMVGLVYLALPLLYTVVAVLIGYLGFMFPQIFLHRGIMLEKNKILSPLKEKYQALRREFIESLESKKADSKRTQIAIVLNSLVIVMNDIKNDREWAIDYSYVVKVLSSGALIVVIKYFLTGTV